MLLLLHEGGPALLGLRHPASFPRGCRFSLGSLCAWRGCCVLSRCTESKGVVHFQQEGARAASQPVGGPADSAGGRGGGPWTAVFLVLTPQPWHTQTSQEGGFSLPQLLSRGRLLLDRSPHTTDPGRASGFSARAAWSPESIWSVNLLQVFLSEKKRPSGCSALSRMGPSL